MATVLPNPNHNAKADAEVLRKAMKGLGTDEKAIIEVVGARTRYELEHVALEFKTMYGRDLLDDIDSEISGNFKKVVRARIQSGAHYDAECLRDAIAGAGTNEQTLIEILATRSNAEIQAIRGQYKIVYKKDLEEDIKGDTSGDFKKLLVSLVQGNRDESPQVNMAQAEADAKALYDAGEKKWGTDESKFNEILASRSFGHIHAVSDLYKNHSKKTLLEAIESETSGNFREGLVAVVKSAVNRAEYFAERCYSAMKGAGTDDKALIRAVCTRCEVDMAYIKAAFQAKYKKTLYKFIEEDTSGDYEKILLKMVGN